MQPNPDLISQVRAGLILKGTSLSKVCLDKGVDPSNATKALKGTWTGEKAQQIKDFLIAASNADTFAGGAV